MRKNRLLYTFIFQFIFLLFSCNKNQVPNRIYLDQHPPKSKPIIFAPNIVSTDSTFEHSITFSKNGNEIFYSQTDETWQEKIMVMRFVNGAWSQPAPLFSIDGINAEPFLSPDNKSIYFASNRSPSQEVDIWMMRNKDGRWLEPTILDSNINSKGWDYHPSISALNNLYYYSWRNNDSKGTELYYSNYKNGKYGKAIKLEYPINSNYHEINPFISPNEDYLLFQSDRPGGYGKFDLYVSYRKDDNSWTNPKNLGPIINTNEQETNIDISPDGKYIFFARRVNKIMDIYWMSSNIIDSLRHTNFIPYIKNSIQDTSIFVGEPFKYKIPDNTFYDDDSQIQNYTVSLEKNEDLPQWLKYDSEKKRLEGIPTKESDIIIEIIATDNHSKSISEKFKIYIKSKE